VTFLAMDGLHLKYPGRTEKVTQPSLQSTDAIFGEVLIDDQGFHKLSLDHWCATDLHLSWCLQPRDLWGFECSHQPVPQSSQVEAHWSPDQGKPHRSTV